MSMCIFTHTHTVTMIIVLMGTGISALTSLMDPVSQALGTIRAIAIALGAAISKAVTSTGADCSVVLAPMLKKLYPDTIIRILYPGSIIEFFGLGSSQEHEYAAEMLGGQTQGLAQDELEVYLHTVHAHYIACGFVWLHCPALYLRP